MRKTISLMISLVLLLLPFGVLLNVKATAITFNLDDNTTNGQGKKVLNQVTNGVKVNYINNNDVLAMYKLLDVYYDTTSNQVSYGFTSSFGTYANAQNPTLTVNDYLGKSTESSKGNDYRDDSQFNALVSSYAMYVRANNVSSTYSMTTNHYTDINNDEDYYYASKTNVEAGVYLILPSSNPVTTVVTEDGIDEKSILSYSVMIANVVPTVDDNDDWVFEDVVISAKIRSGETLDFLADINVSSFGDLFTGQVNVNLNTAFNYITGQDYTYVATHYMAPVPANAHASIKALEINGTLNMIDIIYPSALTPDLTEVYAIYDGLLDARISNNKYYVTIVEDENSQEAEYATITETTGKITFDYEQVFDDFFSIVYGLDIDEAALSNSIGGNTITTVTYDIKDPYIDIGSNVTKSDIRAAFDSSDANYNSTKSVNIRKAVERVEQTVTLYTTGLTINNTNSSNAALTGGEFAVYETYSNGTYSNQLGSNIVISNGTGTLSGLDPTQTYYLKQVKTPSGYRLYDDKIIVLPGSNDDTQYGNEYQVVSVSNGMYTANIVNQLILALPFTGGSGTVIYTVIGLIIVVGAGIFLVLYRKKNKKDEKK